MEINHSSESIESVNFTAAHLCEGCQLVLGILGSERYREVLNPYETVTRHNLDSGFLSPLWAALKLGATHESAQLSVITEEMASRATACAYGFSGMRVSWALNAFARSCDAYVTLTPVKLAEILRSIITDLSQYLPTTAEPLLNSADLDFSAQQEISLQDVWGTATYALLAAVSIPEIGTEGGAEQILQPSEISSDLRSLEPDLVAFLILSLGMTKAVATNPEDLAALEAAVDEVIFRLPHLTRPTPVTARAQRLYSGVFDIQGPAGTLSQYRAATTSKDVIWAVGGADLFGWENWHLVHRTFNPVGEIPDFSERSNVLIISPPPAVELGHENVAEPISNEPSSNVVTLQRTIVQQAIRPSVLVLTHCKDLIHELLPMGVDVLYNYHCAVGLKNILSAATSYPITVITSDKASADLLQGILSKSDFDLGGKLVHVTTDSEVEAFHKARYACSYYHGENEEDFLVAIMRTLEEADRRMVSVSSTDWSLQELFDSELAVERDDSSNGNINWFVELPINMDAFQFQSLESALARLTKAAQNIYYYQGVREHTITIVQTW